MKLSLLATLYVFILVFVSAQDACYNCAYKLHYQVLDYPSEDYPGFVNRFYTCLQDCYANTWSDCVEKHWECVAKAEKTKVNLEYCFSGYQKCWDDKKKKE